MTGKRPPAGAVNAVTGAGDHTFRVEVTGPGVNMAYVVEVPEGLADELGWGDAPEADLVRASFEFLLEREPPGSILRSFSLEVIGNYFPEYRSEMRRRSPGSRDVTG